MTVRLRTSLVALACLGLAVMTAACGSDTNTTTPTAATSCTFSIVQPTTTFGPEGGTSTATVTAASGCAWTSTSSAAFLTISQGATGNGNGSVAFAVAVNTGAERTATLAIAGTNIAITQRAATTSPTTTGTLAAPTARSPIGGAAVDPGTPTLVVNNAAATGTVGTVTYRFEVSDQPGFAADRTFAQEGVAQGSGTTSWIVNHTLNGGVLWYWHARATNGTTTTAYSATETFRTTSACAFTVSPTSASVSAGGGTVTVTVTTDSACSWTATSNSSFITVAAGASGTGNGTVTATVAAASGAARTGTLTVAGQTVTIAQSAAAGISASFLFFDNGLSTNPTTECRITSGIATTCTLQSTSVPLGTNGLVSYSWTAQWTDGNVITRTQDGPSPSFAFIWTCGGPGSTDDGAARPLAVTLTVTDSSGNTATATAGSGSQPPLFLRLFKC